MKKNAFTLIEILAVIVILSLTFLFIISEISELIKRGENTNKDLVEERLINAAKEYVTNYDDDFYDDMINVGDVKYISKEELFNNNLIEEEDIKDFETFTRIKCELLENDKLKYTIEYST